MSESTFYSGRFLKKWLEIGRNNLWIRAAIDPPFTERSFYECRSFEELKIKLHHGSWCLGQAFVLGEFCFINQDDGGSEWLTIRGKVQFESISGSWAIESSFDETVEKWRKSTDKQLRDLEF